MRCFIYLNSTDLSFFKFNISQLCLQINWLWSSKGAWSSRRIYVCLWHWRIFGRSHTVKIFNITLNIYYISLKHTMLLSGMCMNFRQKVCLPGKCKWQTSGKFYLIVIEWLMVQEGRKWLFQVKFFFLQKCLNFCMCFLIK